MKRRALVVCPGRGTYDRDSLGYFARHRPQHREFIDAMDAYRRDQDQTPVSILDAAPRFRHREHSAGDNASALIYTAAMCDFLSIDRDAFEIVAVTGNSMGWYLALAASGACDMHTGMHIVDTMGRKMHEEAPGGQVVFSLCNPQWQHDAKLFSELKHTRDNAAGHGLVYDSIFLGGIRVLAGDQNGVDFLLEHLPRVENRYPFALPMHGAFHSPLMRPISVGARDILTKELFHPPTIPLIDGRGQLWSPYYSDVEALHHYTFGEQVTQPYNFSLAIDVALKEFSPEVVIVLGPGNTLTPPIAQKLIAMQWQDIRSKNEFKNRQERAPLVLAMGHEAQRKQVSMYD